MKLLNPRNHGFVDYLVVALFAFAPTLLSLDGTPANLSYLLACVHLAITLLTNMPLGAIKKIPMKVHGLIELVVAPTLVASPFIFGFSAIRTATLFYMAFGAVVFVAWLVTDYNGNNLNANTNSMNENERRSA